MKKILILVFIVAGFYSCDRATEAENDNVELEADKDDRQNYDDMNADGEYYSFTGTAPERKSSFDAAASQLSSDIQKLKASTTDDDVIEKLDEVQEKIGRSTAANNLCKYQLVFFLRRDSLC